MICIEEVDNGYVVKTGAATRIAQSLEEVFDDLLMHFEGRTSWTEKDRTLAERKNVDATRGRLN